MTGGHCCNGLVFVSTKHHNTEHVIVTMTWSVLHKHRNNDHVISTMTTGYCNNDYQADLYYTEQVIATMITGHSNNDLICFVMFC